MILRFTLHSIVAFIIVSVYEFYFVNIKLTKETDKMYIKCSSDIKNFHHLDSGITSSCIVVFP